MTAAPRTQNAKPVEKKETTASETQDTMGSLSSTLRDTHTSEPQPRGRRCITMGANDHPCEQDSSAETNCQREKRQSRNRGTPKEAEVGREKHQSRDRSEIAGRIEQPSVTHQSSNEITSTEDQSKTAIPSSYEDAVNNPTADQLMLQNQELQTRIEKILKREEGWKGRYKYLLGKCVLPYAAQKRLKYSDINATAIDHVIRPLLQDAQDATPLRNKVLLLQKGMLANVEKVESMSDDQFKQAFRSLAASIKTLSRNIKFSSDVDVRQALTPCVLVSKAQEQHWSSSRRKKYLVEAFVWSVLITNVFQTPFKIFGQACDYTIQALYKGIFGDQHHTQLPVPSELAERWRCTTVEHLVGRVGSEVITHGVKLNMDTDIEDGILHARGYTADVIASNLCHIAPSTNFVPLEAIVNKSFALALQMSLQRCRVHVIYPSIGDAYLKGETLHLANVPDSEHVEEGYVAFTINPGLVKWGDAHGKNLDEQLDLVPAEVFVEPFIEENISAAEGGVEVLIDGLEPSNALKSPSEKVDRFGAELDVVIKKVHAMDSDVEALANGTETSDQDQSLI